MGVRRFSTAVGAFVVGLLALAGLAACAPGEAPAQKLARAQTMTPADATLAEKYERSCKACHTVLESQAPLAGDVAAWDARFAQGLETLVTHARDGFKAMPPRGQCLDCTDEDLRRLTTFMAGRER